MIYIGADHGGFKLKREIIAFLKEKGHDVKDIGAKILHQDDDFPQFAFKVAHKVAEEKGSLGILICRNGIGMSIAANKVKGIKAGLVSFVGQAITARAHDNCNILVLPADFIDQEHALKIIDTYLKTRFSKEKRYLRRLKVIEEYEKERKIK